ncbi:protein CPR-5-like [Typha latifolia]|uniref:protein CPR-5-like n=1 Tax=Typha latifolia TaxID=4733 RepID=UPI003C308199
MEPLLPCSTKSSHKACDSVGYAAGEGGDDGGGVRGGPSASGAAPTLEKTAGDVISTVKKGQRDAASSSFSSSSSSPSLYSRRAPPSRRGGLRLRCRRRSSWTPHGSGYGDDSIQELALPVGMSFAAVIAQVLDGMNICGERLSVDHLSMICSSAVKESVTNIYGDRFNSFTSSFEKSFGSTLKTLRLINETSIFERRSTACSSSLNSCPVTAANFDLQSPVAEFQENLSLNSMNSQLIVRGQVNQQIAYASHSKSCPDFNQRILTTFEKSVNEQTRCNDLKAFEIGLTMKKLQLKHSQLALSSYTHVLEKIKISMGISKATFRKEKLRNQMQDIQHAEFIRKCIDLLVGGLIIMSCSLVCGASVYSYQRITEVTSACTATDKESKSWWIPNPVASFNSAWLTLRCQFVALTQMLSGILMILTIAWLVFQRAALSGPHMPVSFILVLLGIFCGFAGKLCVDTLGGDGYYWLLYWEALCLLHFFANVFPSAFYGILYGSVSMSQGIEVVRLPYWIRRYIFYSILMLILPVSAGLLPFASVHDWKEHFTKKMMSMNTK